MVQNGRKIYLEEKADGLYLKVTGLLDGIQATREDTEAKSPEQLKAEHPKAFELYQQFTFVGMGVRMNPPVDARKK